MSMRYQAGVILTGYNGIKVPNAPTIGTATAGTSNCASVSFTAPTCIGGGVISSYIVFSSCGAQNKTGATSPLVVTGLTTGSNYTFKAVAVNSYGPSAASAASNSITATVPTCATFVTAGTFTWVAPTGVTYVSVVAIGGAGGGYTTGSVLSGGAGGGLGYKNGIAVTPGTSYTVAVGAGGFAGSGSASYFQCAAIVAGNGGSNGSSGGSYVGDGGGTGGSAFTVSSSGGCAARQSAGGGGAGGYSGAGGAGGISSGAGGAGGAGAGGGGGGGYAPPSACITPGIGSGAGGGTGLYGQGSNGAAGIVTQGQRGGRGGSGGGNGICACACLGGGGTYGGGNSFWRYSSSGQNLNNPSQGAVRIVWAGGSRGTPQFPSTNVGP